MKEQNLKSYYGSEEIDLLSYLEFGSIDIKNAKKTVWGYWQHQDAYDLYMFARYARDLLLFREFFEQKEKSIGLLNRYIKNSAHDKILDYIFKYAGILTVIKNDIDRGVCESGSSLFGLIDEVIAADYVFSNGKNIEKIKQLKYLGSDISEMMNKGAELFHPDMRFEFSVADTISKLVDEFKVFGLFYGLSVSLRYALREAGDLVKVSKSSDIVILNRISMAYGDNRRIEAGTGKYAYVISIDELKKMLKEEKIYARYSTANMQFNKDGERTVRASLVISKEKRLVEDFMSFYDNCIDTALKEEVINLEEGEWREFEEL